MLGFMLQYDSVKEVETVRFDCGGHLTSERGFLASPSYPDYYPEDQSCIYTISVTDRRFITITFSVLDVKCNADVGSDFIEIRDGSSQNSPLMIKDCSDGKHPPMKMQSTQNHLWIK